MSMKKEKPGKTKVTKEIFDAVHVMHRGGGYQRKTSPWH